MGIRTIYLDLDGVIVDFRGGCEKIEAIRGNEVEWEKVHVIGKKFWEELEWIVGGKDFYRWLEEYCRSRKIELCILTHVSTEEGIEGRYNWIKRNIGIESKKIYIVSSGRSKMKYASEDSLLIDDYGRNVREFILAGGKAIKFKNYKQVEEEIKTIVV